MGIYNSPVSPRLSYVPPAPVAPPPPPPPAAPAAPAVASWPMPTTPTAPTQPTAPTPVIGNQTTPGMSVTAPLDLVKIVTSPIQTVKSLFLLTKDLIALQTKKGMTVATAAPSMAAYAEARKHLEEAPFRKIFPFFERAIDKWAFARFQEVAPAVQASISQRAWHPIQLEWPEGGSGHDCLTEVMMLANAAATASDGQIVKALQGANRIQFHRSAVMDYFYPLAREGDALVLRRNLAIIPGQKSLEETLAAYMQKKDQVGMF